MSENASQLKSVIENLTDIPTLPTVVSKITTLMQNPRTSAGEVGQAITTDQSLTSKTLKLVNSAFYGFPGRINTITHAIVILGFTTVKNIVLTASIFDALSKKGRNQFFDVEAFWLHSIATGAISKVIAENMKSKYTEEAFIGGLLHDLGKVICNICAEEEYNKVIRYQRENDCLIKDAELKVLKVTHQDVGGWIASKWNLPKDLSAVLQYHHYPLSAGAYEELASIVHLADILCRGLGVGSGGDNKVPIVEDSVWNKLKLDNMDFEKLLNKAETEIDKASVFLQAI